MKKYGDILVPISDPYRQGRKLTEYIFLSNLTVSSSLLPVKEVVLGVLFKKIKIANNDFFV